MSLNQDKVHQFCSKTCCEDYKKLHCIVTSCEYCQEEKTLHEMVKFSGVKRPFCSEGIRLPPRSAPSEALSSAGFNHLRVFSRMSSSRLQAALQAGLHKAPGSEVRQLQPLQPAVQEGRDPAAGRHDAGLLRRGLRQEVQRLVLQGRLCRRERERGGVEALLMLMTSVKTSSRRRRAATAARCRGA